MIGDVGVVLEKSPYTNNISYALLKPITSFRSLCIKTTYKQSDAIRQNYTFLPTNVITYGEQILDFYYRVDSSAFMQTLITFTDESNISLLCSSGGSYSVSSLTIYGIK